MGFETGSLTKTKAISLHRAARRAIAATGSEPLIDRDTWEDYIARAANVGSRTQAHNLNWRLERLGLIQVIEGQGVHVLPNDYSGILLDD